MKNDFGGLLVTGGDVTYVPHQNWRSDTLRTNLDMHGMQIIHINMYVQCTCMYNDK